MAPLGLAMRESLALQRGGGQEEVDTVCRLQLAALWGEGGGCKGAELEVELEQVPGGVPPSSGDGPPQTVSYGCPVF